MSCYIRGVWLGGYIMLFGLVGLQCASESTQRQKWQDCGAVYHEECWDRPPSLARQCEYEYYEECVNAG
jgi:hypothetical protein